MSYKIECNPESEEIYIKNDKGNVVHHSHTIEQQRADLAMFVQETRQLQFESKSQQCRRTHLQNCHICEDVRCCDNTSEAKIEITRLRSELAELKAKLPKTKDGVPLVPYKGEAWQSTGLWYRKAKFWRLFDDGWYISPDAITSFFPVSSCYSTEQAAREAKEGGAE